MRPLAVHESENSLALETDAFLKPNKSFNDDQGKLSLFVRFLECPQYREIRPRGELTQEEFDVTWYSENEYHYMKTVNIVTVRMMLFGHSLDPEIYCPRGLECRTAEGWQRRQRNKQMTKSAVLREQEIQNFEGVFDAELFEQVSREASSLAREEAIERAVQDEVEARNFCSCSDDEGSEVEGDSIDLTYFSFLSV